MAPAAIRRLCGFLLHLSSITRPFTMDRTFLHLMSFSRKPQRKPKDMNDRTEIVRRLTDTVRFCFCRSGTGKIRESSLMFQFRTMCSFSTTNGEKSNLQHQFLVYNLRKTSFLPSSTRSLGIFPSTVFRSAHSEAAGGDSRRKILLEARSIKQ